MKTRRWIFISVLAIVTILVSASKAFSDLLIWRDDFDGSLDASWIWIPEDPEMWSLEEEPGSLRIYTSSTATFQGNLLLRTVTTEDFVIETRLMFRPEANFQFAGLVIYQDTENFLQLGRAYAWLPELCPTCVGNGIYFDRVQGGNLTDGNFATTVENPSEAYLRLERRGAMVKAFFSEEGTRWFEIGTQWIPDEFEVSGVGLVASQNFDPEVPPIAADFDYFELAEGGGFFPEGYHDYDQGDVPHYACNAGGWAVDADDRSVQIEVEIVVDDGPLTTVPANQQREDLTELCDGGYCGFFTEMWGMISPYETHVVTAYAQDYPSGEWVRLSSSPKELTCRTYDIYVYDTKTGETRAITYLQDSWEFNPRWSPDGTKIVHDRWAIDFSSNYGLHITDVNTGKSVPLAGGENGNYAAWSPNGRWIAFSQNDSEIFIVEAEGGTPILVAEGGSMPTWSPNSKRLAFSAKDGSIYTVDVQGKGEVVLVGPGEAAAWAPNGQSIAYTMDGDLWKVRVDRLGNPLGDPIQLTFDPGWEGRASWSQDSKTIVFHADYGEDTDIWTIPAVGGFPTRLTGGEYFDDYDPNYSNNGRYVAYSSYTPNVQAYTPLPRIVASAEGNWFWTTDFRQGTIYISIYESQEPGAELLWQGEKDTDGSGFAMIEPGDHGLDLVPGNLVKVADRVTTKTLVLEDITITVFDAENDYLAGFSPPHTRVWVAAGPQDWQEGISVRSDGKTGEWEADFSSVGFDVTEDMRPWSYAQIFDEDGDANEADPPPEIFEWHRLNPDRNNDTPEHEVLGCEVYSGWTCTYAKVAEPELGFEDPPDATTGSFSGGEVTGDWSCPGWFDPSVCDTMTSVVEGTMTYHLPDYSEFDIGLQLVLVGTDVGPSLYTFWPDWETYCPWYADFESALAANPFPHPFNSEDWPDEDCVSPGPPAMGLRVNYGHDWVESFYEEGHTVYVTVTEPDGETVKGTATAFTEPKEYWGWESGFTTWETGWDGEVPNLQPGDWVYAEVDNGVSTQVKLGDIQGIVDINNNNVMGTIEAAWIEDPVWVECLDWGSGLENPTNKDFGELNANGSDTYECSWDPESEWDIQSWQDVGVGYATPDGHWVANAFRGEYWVAIWTYDYPGLWAEGDHGYYMQWAYSLPAPGDGHVMDPVYFNVTSSATDYPGYAMLFSRAALTPLVWIGDSCEVSTSIHPNQATRFGWGWVNDYSMTYEEATDHFSSFNIQVFWDGEPGGSAVMAQGDLVPWYGPGTSDVYRCSLTGNP